MEDMEDMDMDMDMEDMEEDMESDSDSEELEDGAVGGDKEGRGRGKRSWKKIPDFQKMILCLIREKCPRLDKQEKMKLAGMFNLNYTTIQNWFYDQNRSDEERERRREKRKEKREKRGRKRR